MVNLSIQKKYKQSNRTPIHTILGGRGVTFIRSLKIVVVLVLLLTAAVFILPQAEADGDGYLQISPSSGEPGTEIQVSVDVDFYIRNELPDAELQDYIGLKYKVVWDAGGWPEPFKYGGNLWSQTTWKIIGSAVVTNDGFLRGTATILREWEILHYGEHWIFVLWEGAIDVPVYMRAWWWTGFTVEEQEEFSLTVHVEGSGSVAKVPNQLTYSYGQTVTLTASPDSDWKFSGWKGDAIGADDEVTIIMDRDKTVTAVFTENGPGPCVMVTAVYGSPLEEEVAFTRHVRDDLIGSTGAGRFLVSSWNNFYYLWSPPLASLITKSEISRCTVRALLVPLLGTMHILTQEYQCLAYLNPELASIATFMTAAMLATAIYIVLPLLLARVIIRHVHSSKTNSTRKQ